MIQLRRVLSLLFLFLFAAAGLFGCTLADTPRRSLSELRSALLSHDAEQAVRYIDVDSVVEGLVRDALARYEKKADNPLAALGVMAGRQAADLLMPGLQELARQELKQAIASPDQAGYFQDIKRSSVWYLTITQTGDTALVVPRGKSDIRFRMARTDRGYWRIVEITRK